MFDTDPNFNRDDWSEMSVRLKDLQPQHLRVMKLALATLLSQTEDLADVPQHVEWMEFDARQALDLLEKTEFFVCDTPREDLNTDNPYKETN